MGPRGRADFPDVTHMYARSKNNKNSATDGVGP